MEITPLQRKREMPAEADFSPFPLFGQVYDTTIVRMEQLFVDVLSQTPPLLLKCRTELSHNA